MMLQIIKPILVLLLLSLSFSTGLSQDARLIAKNIFPSVVMLEMRDDKGRPISLGSGFFVRPDVVATNYHVIEGASAGVAKIVGKTSIYEVEGVVGVDKAKDLVLLKLTKANSKPLVLADISKIEVGQEIFALGNPKGLEGTISAGIISGSSLRQVENENLIQITAPISPGSSGGPVVNKRGEVIGVAVASLKGGQNLNFAIPSSYLAILLAKSTDFSPLSSVLGTRGEKPGTPDSEPSVSEITAWLTNQLAAREESTGLDVNKNERLAFEGCSMNFVLSRQAKEFKLRWVYTYLADLSKLRLSYPRLEGRMVFLDFPPDSIQVRTDEYYDGIMDSSNTRRGDAVEMVVGNEELALRLSKAFNRLKELCKAGSKKEPF